MIKGRVSLFIINSIKTIFSWLVYVTNRSLLRQNRVLKNKHKGARCFILGSAPSINNIDLSLLKDEITFPLNNFYVHPKFKELISGSGLQYYMIAPIHPPQSTSQWLEWLKGIDKFVPNTVVMLFGINWRRKLNLYKLIRENGLFTKNTIFYFFAGKFYSDVLSNKSCDFSKMLISARAVSTYAVLLAMYMGFNKIYLLGVDQNYICTKKKRFYSDAIHNKYEHDSLGFDNEKLLLSTATVLRENKMLANIAKSKGVEIINLSDESILDMYKHGNISDVL